MSSKTTAGLRCRSSSGDAALRLTIAPRGASEPESATMPPSGASGASSGAITRRSSAAAASKPSASDRPVTAGASAVEQRRELGEDGSDPAGAVEVLDDVLARRPDVGEHRCPPRELVEAVERERHVDAAGEREEVDDGVRAAADRHQQ